VISGRRSVRLRSTTSTTQGFSAFLADSPLGDWVGKWLRAGVIENGRFRTDRGGQSPGRGDQPRLLFERGAARAGGGPREFDTATTGFIPSLGLLSCEVADDMVACCHSRQQAEQVKTRLAGWLEPRGLAFNEDKTRIVPSKKASTSSVSNVRRYRRGTPTGKVVHQAE